MADGPIGALAALPAGLELKQGPVTTRLRLSAAPIAKDLPSNHASSSHALPTTAVLAGIGRRDLDLTRDGFWELRPNGFQWMSLKRR